MNNPKLRFWFLLTAALLSLSLGTLFFTLTPEQPRWPIFLVCVSLALLLFSVFLAFRSTHRALDTLSKEARSLTPDVKPGSLKVKDLGSGLEIEEALQGLREQLKFLNAERDQLDAVLQGMREGLLVTDQNESILLANPSFYRIFNLENRCEGKTVLEVLINKPLHDILVETIQTRQPAERNIPFNIQGKERHFIVHCSPLTTHSISKGAVLAFFEVTDIRNLERSRRDFVANVSHELKTPLTNIRGYVETLMGGATSDKATTQRFLDKIHQNSKHLENLIEDLLRLSEIESGRSPLKPKTFSALPVFKDTLNIFRDELEKNQLQIEGEIAPDLEVSGEPALLKQILVNLLHNAIKYNRKGGLIKVSAEENGSHAKFTVSDTGMGIPAKDLPHIFERFYRVEKGRSRDQGGTGLGLAIVKHLVQAHGGQVLAQSTEGQGSSFSFTLPLPPSAQA